MTAASLPAFSLPSVSGSSRSLRRTVSSTRRSGAAASPTWVAGGVPLVFKHIVIVGSNNGEVTQGPSPGDTKAFDARTGKQLWTFKSVAQPGDKNHSTWLDEGWKNRQGVNHWGWYFTLDEQREILYTVFGSPAGNYWGGDRPGANLYGNSVVAVDVNSGKYLWHFQSVHHDLWDSDQPSPHAHGRNAQRAPYSGARTD